VTFGGIVAADKVYCRQTDRDHGYHLSSIIKEGEPVLLTFPLPALLILLAHLYDSFMRSRPTIYAKSSSPLGHLSLLVNGRGLAECEFLALISQSPMTEQLTAVVIDIARLCLIALGNFQSLQRLEVWASACL